MPIKKKYLPFEECTKLLFGIAEEPIDWFPPSPDKGDWRLSLLPDKHLAPVGAETKTIETPKTTGYAYDPCHSHVFLSGCVYAVLARYADKIIADGYGVETTREPSAECELMEKAQCHKKTIAEQRKLHSAFLEACRGEEIQTSDKTDLSQQPCHWKVEMESFCLWMKENWKDFSPLRHFPDDKIDDLSEMVRHIEELPESPEEPIGQDQPSLMVESEPPYLFRKCGDTWKIIFNGTVTEGLKNLDGMKYIQSLLQSPDKELSSEELYSTKSFLPDQTPAQKKEASQLANSDSGGLSLGLAHDEIMDKQTVKQLQSRKKEIEAWLEEYKASSNTDNMDKQHNLEDELHTITEQLKKNTGKGGQPRTFSDSSDKRSTVKKAIGLAIDHICECSKTAADHLRTTIRTGGKCIYEPINPPLNWEF